MSRLTNNNNDNPLLKNVGHANCKNICEHEVYCDMCPIQEAIDKLCHYEDLEEQGRLIELPCKTVYYFDNKLLMSKPIDFLTVYEVLGIDEDGKYWSTIEKATAKIAKLAELKGTEE